MPPGSGWRHLNQGHRLASCCLPGWCDVVSMDTPHHLVQLCAAHAVTALYSLNCSCSFGRDTEESTVMTLSRSGIVARRGQLLPGMAVHLKGPAQQRLQHR